MLSPAGDSLASKGIVIVVSLPATIECTRWRPGQKRLIPKKASTVLMPANSTITSNVIGTNAGSEFQGFPPTLMGQSVAVVQYSNQNLNDAPKSPSAKQTQGSVDRSRPMALSRPCTA